MNVDLKFSLLRIAYEPAIVLTFYDSGTCRIVDRELPGIGVLETLGYIKIKTYPNSFDVTRAWLTELGESEIAKIPTIDCVYTILAYKDWEYNKSFLGHYMEQLAIEELPVFLVSTDAFVRSIAKAIYDRGGKHENIY